MPDELQRPSPNEQEYPHPQQPMPHNPRNHRAWLSNLRASGKLLFPIFRDGTGTIQGIVPKAAVPEEVFETLKNLTLESSLTVTGNVRADSRAPSGYELDVESIEVLQR